MRTGIHVMEYFKPGNKDVRNFTCVLWLSYWCNGNIMSNEQLFVRLDDKLEMFGGFGLIKYSINVTFHSSRSEVNKLDGPKARL